MSMPFLADRVPTGNDQPPSTLPTPKTQRYKWLKLALRLGCSTLLFTFLFKSFSWSAVLQQLSHLDDGGLVIAVMVGMSGVMISAYQWHSLLAAEHIHIDLKKLVNFYLVGLAFNHFLPTGMGGDVVKAYYVGKEGNNTAGSVSAVIMSRITGFCGMLLVSLTVLLLWHSLFTHQLTLIFLVSCLALCGALAGVFCAVLLLPRFLQGKCFRRPLFLSICNTGNTIRKSIAQPRSMATATLFGALFHVSAALNYYSYATLMHIPVPVTFYLVAIPLVALSTVLPTSINGYGVRESTLVFVFSTVHVPGSTALALALLADVQTLLFGVLGGCIYLMMGVRNKRSEMALSREPVHLGKEEPFPNA